MRARERILSNNGEIVVARAQPPILLARERRAALSRGVPLRSPQVAPDRRRGGGRSPARRPTMRTHALHYDSLITPS